MRRFAFWFRVDAMIVKQDGSGPEERTIIGPIDFALLQFIIKHDPSPVYEEAQSKVLFASAWMFRVVLPFARLSRAITSSFPRGANEHVWQTHLMLFLMDPQRMHRHLRLLPRHKDRRRLWHTNFLLSLSFP